MKKEYSEILKILEHCSDGTEKGIIQSIIDFINLQDTTIRDLTSENEILKSELYELQTSSSKWKQVARDFEEASKEMEKEIERMKIEYAGFKAGVNQFRKDFTNIKFQSVKEFADKFENELAPTISSLFMISETLVDVSKSHISAEDAIKQIREKLNNSNPICSKFRLNQMKDNIVKEMVGD